MRNIIFYLPYRIKENYISGSIIRPKRMIEAFEKIGYKVYPVVGSSTERAKAISEIKKLINSGYKFEFLYGESANFPTILTDEDHVPRNPFLDFNFFRFIKSHKIPTGLFYRDIYWRFESYKMESNLIKMLITIPLFLYDLLCYKMYIDVLFVPSQRFVNYIPLDFNQKTYLLPPGCDIVDNPDNFYGDIKNFLRVLYIGNVEPRDYNISILFNVAKHLENDTRIQISISCPMAIWEEWSYYYLSKIGGKVPANVSIFHKKPGEIDDLYFNSDLFVIPISNEYSKMASKIKFYEAIGYGLPILIIVNGDSEMGDLVKREKIGWVVQHSEEKVVQFFNYLLTNPQELKIIRENVIKIREKHTWEERAKLVANVLKGRN